MELNIKIEKNDFMAPTEIREAVVQGIVDYFMKWKINADNTNSKTFFVDEQDVIFLDGAHLRTIRRWNIDGKEKMVRVHSIEMEAAFKVMSEAGYFFYALHNITQRTYEFMFSKYPINGRTARTDAHFGLCID